MRESNLLKTIQLEASKKGYRLLRNQVGTYKLADGRYISSGIPGSSDLIGWKTVTITPEMVNKKIAVYCAFEIKTPSGRMDKKGKQQRFIDAVNAAGGIGKVVRDISEI